MGSMTSVANVVVIPRNGYANRLQAWASAAIVARTWGAPLKVCWEEEAVCPADASSLFRSAGEGSTFISSDEVEGLLGGSHEGLPRYLAHDSDSGVVTLATDHHLGRRTVVAGEDHQRVVEHVHMSQLGEHLANLLIHGIPQGELEQASTRSALLAYCERDTLTMVELVKRLRAAARQSWNSPLLY